MVAIMNRRRLRFNRKNCRFVVVGVSGAAGPLEWVSSDPSGVCGQRSPICCRERDTTGIGVTI